MELTVACVLKMGTFRDRQYPYTPMWVEKLKAMVERHLGKHRFVCLSDVKDLPCERLAPLHGLPGWWAKLELFDPRYALGDRVLYLDLDSLVVGDLESIFEVAGEFALAPSLDVVNGQGKLAIKKYNSSVMVWTPGKRPEIIEEFSPALMGVYRGDQDWIAQICPSENTLPEAWVSKLKYCKGGPGKGMKVVLCMPWKNQKAAEMFPWVGEIWC